MMNFATTTSRMLLIPLLVIGLTVGGFATPALSSIAGAKDCCQGVAISSACCGSPCCQAPVPQPERRAADHSKRMSDRPSDGKIAWASGFNLHRDHGQAAHNGHALTVPASRSPSLITQHVRLQI